VVKKNMAQLHPYLRFDGNAQEAFDFYKSILGGELTVTKVGDSPMAQHMSDKKDNIFHAQLKNENIVILGSDLIPEEGLKKGNSVLLTLECSSKEEAENYFGKLSEGGKIGHALAEMDFGTIGDLQDKFGTDWFVVAMKNS
jgi:PhnB protein